MKTLTIHLDPYSYTVTPVGKNGKYPKRKKKIDGKGLFDAVAEICRDYKKTH